VAQRRRRDMPSCDAMGGRLRAGNGRAGASDGSEDPGALPAPCRSGRPPRIPAPRRGGSAPAAPLPWKKKSLAPLSSLAPRSLVLLYPLLLSSTSVLN
jgi:hypothetical protein